MNTPRKKPIRSEGNCFWCGQLRMLTRDHVPPQSLFPSRVSPATIPAVMACKECNGQWGKNSEYFRDFLMVGPLAKCKHPDLKEIREAYDRARQRRIDRGKNPSIFRGTPLREKGPTGAYTIATLHEVDLIRISDIIWRTVGVIHRLHRDRLLAQQGTGYRAIISDVLAPGPEHEKAMRELRKGNTRYAGGLLKWCDFVEKTNPNVQEWLVCFYDEAVFHYRTSPIADVAPISFIFNRPFGSEANIRPIRHIIS